MKSLIALWEHVAKELATWCCTSTARDLKTVMCRSEHEGQSFLTIALANFGKDFQKSLDLGYVDPSSFLGFKRRGGLPLFLGGFLDRVFDRGSGTLLDDPCVDSIYAVRQLTLLFEKIDIPCTEVRETKAFKDYIKCEQDIRSFDSQLSKSDKLDFLRVRQLLFGDVFDEAERDVYALSMHPKHGPGSTADGLLGNKKFTNPRWTTRLQVFFPAEEYLIPNAHFRDRLDEIEYLEPGAEIPVKVISVPKTQKTPRIIAMEPTAMQYCQQAIASILVDRLENNYKTPGMIGFTDQTPNQRLAELCSVSGSLATVDLSEASDRVSNQHVRLLFQNYRWLFGAIDSCRSRKADVPGFGVQRLAKFASMGSALTFPVEAMVFLTIIFMGIEQELSRPLTCNDVKRLRGQVRVYGDDIIVPIDCVHSVIRKLETFGFRVNRNKTFYTGKFRESCGEEYYAGHRVTTTRVRQMFPLSRRNASQVVSLVSLRNQLFEQGLWQSARYLDGRIRKVIKYYPDVLPSSPGLGRVTSLGYVSERNHPTLHKPLVKAYVVSSVTPTNSVDGIGALMKCFLHKSDEPIADVKHLERSGRPRSVDIKTRWVTPY